MFAGAWTPCLYALAPCSCAQVKHPELACHCLAKHLTTVPCRSCCFILGVVDRLAASARHLTKLIQPMPCSWLLLLLCAVCAVDQHHASSAFANCVPDKATASIPCIAMLRALCNPSTFHMHDGHVIESCINPKQATSHLHICCCSLQVVAASQVYGLLKAVHDVVSVWKAMSPMISNVYGICKSQMRLHSHLHGAWHMSYEAGDRHQRSTYDIADMPYIHFKIISNLSFNAIRYPDGHAE